MAATLSMGSSRNTPVALGTINVTPLVDVMLVLLIIFMVATPLLLQGATVSLSTGAGSVLKPGRSHDITVKVACDRITIGTRNVKRGNLRKMLEDLVKLQPQMAIHVAGEGDVPYGFLTQVIAEAKKAHIDKINLVTQPLLPSVEGPQTPTRSGPIR